ncbi:MAG: tripartite tricarboxylate transporter substrate binding protein [Betaproteobacteria bacterium]|nr:tripartite tricarboxylate transporter substrate binding protein [Betaproteobacteria bacterium]
MKYESAHVPASRVRNSRFAAFAVLICALSLPPIAALAQAYPARPVRIVVPAAPGGGLDIVARIMAGKLAEFWTQTVLVENRPGANMTIGMDSVAKAAPDGYVLLLGTSTSLTVNPVVLQNVPVGLRDFVPISLFSSFAFVLLANNALAVNSLQDFIAHLRANPGKLNHASNSAGTILVSELFKTMAKVDYVDINYKGGVLAAAATAAGETQFCFVDIGSGNSQARGGRARILAVTTAQRTRLYPNIPTVAEAGVPGFVADSWAVVLAPSGTPADVVAKISADLRRMVASPDVIARLEAVGTEPVGSTPEEALRALRADAEQWSRLVKERNLRF